MCIEPSIRGEAINIIILLHPVWCFETDQTSRRVRSSKKVSVCLRVSLALLARKIPPLAMGMPKQKPCRGSEGKKGRHPG